MPKTPEHSGNGNGELQRSVPGQVKAWFRRQNEKGKYLRLRSAWQWLRNVYDYHPRERFLNWLVVQTKRLLGLWQPIELPASIHHTRFHICLEELPQGRRVVKLPHGQNELSCALIRTLKKPGAYARYLDTLTSVKQNPWFQNHSVTVTGVQANGGYSSEYIEGINLAQLREELGNSRGLTQELRQDLTQAVQQLLHNLACHYQKHGKLTGDWPLHNLVFSPDRKAIINVDAEGFFTYDHGSGETHLPFIEANLLNLVDLLKLMDNAEPHDAEILNIFKALDEVRRSGEQYSGSASVVGYHSLELKGKKFRGQRDCQERLAQVPFDFRGKVVADLGCNVGGMLHCLAKTIRKGYGFDVNPNCINAAQLIKKLNESRNLEFFSFDLDEQPLPLLNCFLEGEKVDICFLLSMCRWLKRWEEVVFEASRIAGAMLFESNGTPQQQEKQAALLHKYYNKVMLLSESSPDDFTLRERRLYLCTRIGQGDEI